MLQNYRDLRLEGVDDREAAPVYQTESNMAQTVPYREADSLLELNILGVAKQLLLLLLLLLLLTSVVVNIISLILQTPRGLRPS